MTLATDLTPSLIRSSFVRMTKRRIPENTNDYARRLAGEIANCSAGIRLSPTASLFVGMALEGYAELLDRRESDELAFIVTAIDPSGRGEVMAAAKNLHIATAAFTASVVARPRARIVLRQGVRVLSDHPALEPVATPKED